MKTVFDLKPMKIKCERCGKQAKLWSVPDEYLDEYNIICYNCKREIKS